MLLERLIPQYEHWGSKWRAQLLSSVLFFGLLLAASPLAALIVANPMGTPVIYFLSGLVIFYISVWAIWHRSGLETAANIFVLGSWVIALLAVINGGGVSGPLALPQLFVVLISALLASPRLTMGLVGATAVLNAIVLNLETNGLLPPSVLEPDLAGRLAVQIAIMALSTATILYSNRLVQRLTQELSANEYKFRALFEKTTEAVFLIGPDYRLREVNQRAATLLGYKARDLKGMHISRLFTPKQWYEVEERLGQVNDDEVLEPVERTFLTQSGKDVILETNLAIVRGEDGELMHYQSIGRDVTAKVEEEQRIRSTLAHMTVRASTDALTGLLNREAVMQHARAEWERYVREDKPLSLMLIDMDGLKAINDTHGHLAGDAALKALAQTLENNKRPYDWVGRFGGDEFMVVLPGASWVDTQQITRRVAEAVSQQTIRAAGAQVPVRCSLGVASTDDPERTMKSITELVDLADTELYRAKQNGRMSNLKMTRREKSPRRN